MGKNGVHLKNINKKQVKKQSCTINTTPLSLKRMTTFRG